MLPARAAMPVIETAANNPRQDMAGQHANQRKRDQYHNSTTTR